MSKSERCETNSHTQPWPVASETVNARTPREAKDSDVGDKKDKDVTPKPTETKKREISASP